MSDGERRAAGAPPREDLARLSDTVPAVLYTYVVQPDGRDRLPYVSDRITDWVGHAPDLVQAEPQRLWGAIHAADRARVAEISEAAVEASTTFEAEFRLVHTDGTVRWVRATSHPEVLDADGTRVFHGVIIDITAHRHSQRTQDALRQVLEQVATGAPLAHVLDRLCRHVEARFEGAQCTVMLLERESRTVRFGAAPTMDRTFMEALEGLPIGPEAGSCGTAMHFGTQVITPDIEGDANWAAYLELARRHGLRACWSTPFFRVDGAAGGSFAVYFSQARSPTADDLETLAAAADLAGIAFQRDESQENLQDARDQLHHALKMEAVGRLAGGIAHDFNNILTVILGAGGLLQEILGEDHEAYEEAAMVHEAATRAAGLTRQLLAFSRRQTWAPTAVDVGQSCAHLRPLLVRTLGTEVELEIDVTKDLSPTWIDRGQLEQVLLNLAVNARDAMPEGGRFTLSVEPGELPPSHRGAPAPRIVAADTGHGMSPEVLERVFEPFFSTKPRDKGTGLGLATVYGIVERAGGQVSVTSAVGEGARFVIDLPATDGDGGAPIAVVGTEARGSIRARPGERVLLVEDERAVRQLATRALRSYGYEVQEAASGPEALEALRSAEGRFHLLLTDVVMPKMNGVELVGHARKAFGDLRVLFMSAYTDNLLLVQDPVVRDARLLSKPFDAQQLARTVREVIDAGASEA